jgi:hypothetical protein
MEFFRWVPKRVPHFISSVLSSLLSVTASVALFKVFRHSGMVGWGYVFVAAIPILVLVQLARIHQVYKVAYPQALAGDEPVRKSLVETVNTYYLLNAVVLMAVALITLTR